MQPVLLGTPLFSWIDASAPVSVMAVPSITLQEYKESRLNAEDPRMAPLPPGRTKPFAPLHIELIFPRGPQLAMASGHSRGGAAVPAIREIARVLKAVNEGKTESPSQP